jgi:hypothetical protein
MSKRIYLVVGIWLLLAFVFMAQAQTTTFYSGTGQILGTATTVGNNTFYNNQYGQPVATATNANGVTYLNNAQGAPLGMSIGLNGQTTAAPAVSLFAPDVKKND